MTDDKSRAPGQATKNARALLEENGQLDLLGDSDNKDCSRLSTEFSTNEKPPRARRGLMRPRAATLSDVRTSDSTDDPFDKAKIQPSTASDHDRSRPTSIGEIDDVLDKDILFNFVNTPMLDAESLYATVDDVESSLQILSDDDSEKVDSVAETDNPATKPNYDDPLVLVKSRRGISRHYAECIPAPLPVESDDTVKQQEQKNRFDDSPDAPISLSPPQQTIEEVAHDAVQLMSRSLDAAGSSVLNLELAREIRLNLTELLSEWQTEQLSRSGRTEPAERSKDCRGDSIQGESERRNELSRSSNTYQFRSFSD